MTTSRWKMITLAEAPPRDRTHLWAVPLLVYAVSRVVQLLFVWWMAPDGDVRGRLLSWDGGHFVRVAREGYPTDYTYNDEGVLVGNGLAFFPGYPMLIRLTHLVTRLDHDTSAIAVTWLAGAAAAVLVFALGTRLYDRRVGLVLTVLFCTQPMSLALSMAYSEALFTAFVAGMLLFAHRGWWITAGAFGLAAALTRPTGAAAAVALAVAAVLAVLRSGSRHAASENSRVDSSGAEAPDGHAAERRGPVAVGRWRPIVAAVVSLAGVPAYLTWVGFRVGDPRAWFEIQTAGWGTTFDFGSSTLRFLRDALRAGEGWVQVSVAWLLLGAVALTITAVVQRVWPPLVVYGTIALVLVLGQAGYYHSKPRLLVPILLLLVPAAVWLGRARTKTAALVLAGSAAFGLWYGAYLVTVWHYAI